LNLLQVALSCLEDKDSLAFAKAITLKGQIELNLHEPGKALESFRNSLRLYEGLLAANDARIAWAYNNLGMAYTELSDFDKALTCHEKAVEIRLQNNVERIGNSYSNMSALYLRMGEVTKAEEYLYACPALKNFTDETFLNTNNPRFAGDMVLLSRIRRSQGRAEDAMRIATKALAFRRRLLGNRLTTCDAQYHAADILQYHGNIGPSM
jgi:tetratricopeptide (TPR) repeat protein